MERIIILLECETCQRRNYSMTKSAKKTGTAKLKIMKFCSSCRKQTSHKETKA